MLDVIDPGEAEPVIDLQLVGHLIHLGGVAGHGHVGLGGGEQRSQVLLQDAVHVGDGHCLDLGKGKVFSNVFETMVGQTVAQSSLQKEQPFGHPYCAKAISWLNICSHFLLKKKQPFDQPLYLLRVQHWGQYFSIFETFNV